MNEQDNINSQKLVEGKESIKKNTGPNPFPDITVSLPPIDIEMVNATYLTEYEIWFFLSSIMASFVSAFIILYLQTQNDYIKISSIIMGGFLLFFILMTIYKRIILSKKSGKYRIVGGHLEKITDEPPELI